MTPFTWVALGFEVVKFIEAKRAEFGPAVIDAWVSDASDSSRPEAAHWSVLLLLNTLEELLLKILTKR